jgi:hypothetical protein
MHVCRDITITITVGCSAVLVPVRHSLSHFQRCGAFISDFPNEKFTPPLEIDPKFFHCAFVQCETKGAAGAVCANGN